MLTIVDALEMFPSRGAIWIRCDQEGCGELIDRRPPNDFKNGGTFKKGEQNELLLYAQSCGWIVVDDKHFCSKHATR